MLFMRARAHIIAATGPQKKPRKIMSELRQFDYVIVGAGSAGLVLANRLSADPKLSVCVIEAGKPDKNPFVHVPLGLAAIVRFKSLDWGYNTVPQKELNNRCLYWPRGKVLGGSSSINAMCYIRGAAENYDEWEKLGATGWNWTSVLPHFIQSENNVRGPSVFHGASGPLFVSDNPDPNLLSRVFVEAGTQLQLPHNPDFNDGEQAGVGLFQTTTLKGRRASTAVSYLRPVESRPNLTRITSAMARRILFDGKRASGVELQIGMGKDTIIARREVLVCGGAINSPQLLMLSGIGPASHLAQHGLPLVADLPGVGSNLQDHLDTIIQTKGSTKHSYGVAPRALLKAAAHLPRYLRTGRGIPASTLAEGCGFVHSSKAGKLPDIQWHFIPARIENHGRTTAFGYGYSLHACNLYPDSRGTIRLASSHPFDAPLIDPNYLASQRDLDVMLDALNWSRRVLNAPAFDPYRKAELEPGADVTSRDDLIAFIRNKAESIYHPVGTCKMGAANDEMSVVTPDLKVKGVAALRIIDASVMPRLIGGNTNAPVIMIAERAAEMILAGS
jgi:choline dehydrogenase